MRQLPFERVSRFRLASGVLGAMILFLNISPAFSQGAPPRSGPLSRGSPPAAGQPAAPTAAQRRTTLENQLKSGQKQQIDQAYAGYRAWMAEDGKVGENMFWFARDLFAPLADRAVETLELCQLARAYKEANGPFDMAYLNVMEGQILYQQGKDAEGKAKLAQSLKDEPEVTADQMRHALATVLTPLKKNKELAGLLNEALAVGSGDQEVVETLLKQRLTALNGVKDYAGALACAKSYFNVTTMAHTSDAITLLDRQFLLPNMEDRTQVEQFRREQTAGATATVPGQAARTSAIMLAIKVEAGPYEGTLRKMTDESSLAAITRHVLLLLVADKGKEALEAAKQGLAIAADPKQMTTANELIARCYKAQDGTIGRANGWIASNPQAK